mmetsp:Transcript_11265/g.32536  ORF Transcript_11265/g.32536 Transcript_11265/m.32536 type:complete len:189 (+) Transcript_11265:2-568(+)
MDIGKRDLEDLFEMLDADKTGDVDYQEFVNQLHMLRTSNSHTLLVFVKYYVSELKAKMDKVVERLPKPPPPPPSAARTWTPDASSGGLGEHEPAASLASATWPNSDGEVKTLEALRQEMVDFSIQQGNRMHDRFVAKLRAMTSQRRDFCENADSADDVCGVHRFQKESSEQQAQAMIVVPSGEPIRTI